MTLRHRSITSAFVLVSLFGCEPSRPVVIWNEPPTVTAEFEPSLVYADLDTLFLRIGYSDADGDPQLPGSPSISWQLDDDFLITAPSQAFLPLASVMTRSAGVLKACVRGTDTRGALSSRVCVSTTVHPVRWMTVFGKLLHYADSSGVGGHVVGMQYGPDGSLLSVDTTDSSGFFVLPVDTRFVQGHAQELYVWGDAVSEPARSFHDVRKTLSTDGSFKGPLDPILMITHHTTSDGEAALPTLVQYPDSSHVRWVDYPVPVYLDVADTLTRPGLTDTLRLALTGPRGWNARSGLEVLTQVQTRPDVGIIVTVRDDGCAWVCVHTIERGTHQGRSVPKLEEIVVPVANGPSQSVTSGATFLHEIGHAALYLVHPGEPIDNPIRDVGWRSTIMGGASELSSLDEEWARIRTKLPLFHDLRPYLAVSTPFQPCALVGTKVTGPAKPPQPAC